MDVDSTETLPSSFVVVLLSGVESFAGSSLTAPPPSVRVRGARAGSRSLSGDVWTGMFSGEGVSSDASDPMSCEIRVCLRVRSTVTVTVAVVPSELESDVSDGTGVAEAIALSLVLRRTVGKVSVCVVPAAAAPLPFELLWLRNAKAPFPEAASIATLIGDEGI